MRARGLETVATLVRRRPCAADTGALAHRSRFRQDADIMMARTQISLDHELLRRVRARADELGVSLDEHVRRLLELDLGQAGCPADPAKVFNLGCSSGSNVARDKDGMLGEAFVDELPR